MSGCFELAFDPANPGGLIEVRRPAHVCDKGETHCKHCGEEVRQEREKRNRHPAERRLAFA